MKTWLLFIGLKTVSEIMGVTCMFWNKIKAEDPIPYYDHFVTLRQLWKEVERYTNEIESNHADLKNEVYQLNLRVGHLEAKNWAEEQRKKELKEDFDKNLHLIGGKSEEKT